MYPLAAWCVLMVAAAAPDGYAEGGEKMRRIPGMFPRPIVGRSNPGVTWLLDVSDLAAMEGKPKRGEPGISGLFAYPRVGRGGTDSSLDQRVREVEGKRGLNVVPVGRFHAGAAKRDGDSSNGLWFGPRLGKRAEESPWALITLREYPPNRGHQEAAFTPRLGRESNEDLTEDYDSKHSHGEHI